MGVVSIVDGCGLSLLFVSESWSLCRGAVRCRGRSGQIIAKVGVEDLHLNLPRWDFQTPGPIGEAVIH